MEMLSSWSEAVSRRCSKHDGDFARHGIVRQRLVGEMRNEVTPFLLGALLVVAVVQERGSPGARDPHEDEPIARRKSPLRHPGQAYGAVRSCTHIISW